MLQGVRETRTNWHLIYEQFLSDIAEFGKMENNLFQYERDG